MFLNHFNVKNGTKTVKSLNKNIILTKYNQYLEKINLHSHQFT